MLILISVCLNFSPASLAPMANPKLHDAPNIPMMIAIAKVCSFIVIMLLSTDTTDGQNTPPLPLMVGVFFIGLLLVLLKVYQ